MAPAVEITPSMTTGIRLSAAPSTSPAIPPISKPPTLERMSIGSFGSGRFAAMLSSMTWILCASRASSIPVPRPVSSVTGRPVASAAIAVDGVVLPMPMSPVPSIRTPSAARLRAMAAPRSMHRSACSLVIAGPLRMLAVPWPTFASISAPRCNKVGKIGAAPHVDDAHLDARVPAEHVDAGHPGSETADHLARDLGRVGAHPLRGDSVISRHDDDHLAARDPWNQNR